MQWPVIEKKIKDKYGEQIEKWHAHNERRIYIDIPLSLLKEFAGYLFTDLKARFIIASGDQVANDVMGIKVLQEWYPMVQNKITMDAWSVNQIAQAVKVGVGYARSDEDVKIII